jgi:hypothetical protein
VYFKGVSTTHSSIYEKHYDNFRGSLHAQFEDTSYSLQISPLRALFLFARYMAQMFVRHSWQLQPSIEKFIACQGGRKQGKVQAGTNLFSKVAPLFVKLFLMLLPN